MYAYVHSNFSIRPSNFILRSRADGDQTGFLAIPASQSAASVTAVFSSYFTDRPAAKSAFCSGQHSQLELTCGGDRRYPFVGNITVAACSTCVLLPHRTCENSKQDLTILIPTYLRSSRDFSESLQTRTRKSHKPCLTGLPPMQFPPDTVNLLPKKAFEPPHQLLSVPQEATQEYLQSIEFAAMPFSIATID